MESSRNEISFSSELTELLESAKSPEEKLAARTVVGVRYLGIKLRSVGLRFLESEEQLRLPDCPNALVVGVASYSDPDIKILNDSYEFLVRRGQTFVFDIDRVRSVSDLHKVMPMASLFTRTPVVAEYKGGILIKLFQGDRAASWLTDNSRAI